jgi:hypothetical protein
MNKLVLIAIAIFILAGIALWIYPIEPLFGFPVPDTLFWLAKALVIIIMLANGSFYETIFFKITKLAVAILFLGAIFKIMHIEGADLLIVSTSVLIPFIYLVYFLKKARREFIGYAKVAAVFLRFIPSALLILHLFDREYCLDLILVSDILVAVIFINFTIRGLGDKSLLAQCKLKNEV